MTTSVPTRGLGPALGYNGPVSLKRELESPRSPIRRFLDDRLPHTTKVLDPWQRALKGVKPQLPGDDPSGQPTPNAVLGHAISARIGWGFAPADRPGIRAGAQALVAAGCSAAVMEDVVAQLAGPVPKHPYDAARLSWFAGLFDRAHRSGRWDDATYDPLRTAATAEELLAQVPAAWAADIVAVHRRAERALAPLLGDEGPAPRVGASATAPAPLDDAEAELILGGTVVDLKVTATTKTRLRDLHQVLAVALLDTDDAWGVTHVAVAPVRFGLLVRWDLAELLDTMAAKPVELADLRAALHFHLANTGG